MGKHIKYYLDREDAINTIVATPFIGYVKAAPKTLIIGTEKENALIWYDDNEGSATIKAEDSRTYTEMLQGIQAVDLGLILEDGSHVLFSYNESTYGGTYVSWGSPWRDPTIEELNWIINNTIVTESTTTKNTTFTNSNGVDYITVKWAGYYNKSGRRDFYVGENFNWISSTKGFMNNSIQCYKGILKENPGLADGLFETGYLMSTVTHTLTQRKVIVLSEKQYLDWKISDLNPFKVSD